MIKLFKGFLTLTVCMSMFCVSILDTEAQTSQRERMIEEQKRLSIDNLHNRLFGDEGRLHYEYGAWINYRYNDYDNDDNDRMTRDTLDESFDFDARMWLQLTLKPPEEADYDNEHTFYLRLKNLYINRLPDDLAGGEDNDGPHVDYAYFIFDLRPFIVEAGRRYFRVGRGIAYSNVNDGIQINYLRPKWNIGAFASHTLPHEDNIDTSVPGFDKESDRYFFGAGAGYRGIPRHQIYSYVLVQRDFSDERPSAPLQDYSYQSEYFGLGSLGKINKNGQYWVELIKENGKSRVFATNEKRDVDAWAADVGIEYGLKMLAQPKLLFEYAYGSGDADRISITDTEFGNSVGNDENFLYFGYLPTGYALAPRLSNIHIYRFGLSAKPLEKITFLKDLKWGVDYYLYVKNQSPGGISDIEATENAREIGSEIDVTLNWQIFSDLHWTLEYGHFMPGDAFATSADDPEDYFASSLTFTF